MAQLLLKTISQPDQGIQFQVKPHLINERAWINLQQIRSRLGILTEFPGWASILAKGQNLGGFCTLIFELDIAEEASFLIFGGPSKIFRYNSASRVLTSMSGDQIFHATRDDPWSAVQYFDHLFVVNRQDGLFRFDAGADFIPIDNVPDIINTVSTKINDFKRGGGFTKIAEAPKARSVAILNDHLCLLNTVDDPGDPGKHPTRFAWASTGTDDIWIATPTNDAGRFDLIDTPDEGMRLMILGSDLIAYKANTIIPITFIGGNEVFGRRQTVHNVGLLGQEAIVDLGDEHIFMGPDTFYRYRGGADLDDSVGDKIRDFVYPRLHPTIKNRSRSVYVRQTQEVVFFYPTKDAAEDANEVVVYNIKDDSWYGPFTITQGQASIFIDDVPDIINTVLTVIDQFPSIRGGKGGASMAGVAERSSSPVIDEVSEIINTVSAIIDEFGGVSQGTQILFADGIGNVHEIGPALSADGAPIDRVAETGDQALMKGATDLNGQPVGIPLGAVCELTEVNLELGDFSGFFRANLYVGYRMKLADPIVWSGPHFISTTDKDIKVTNIRVSGRWFRLKFDIPNSQPFSLAGYQWGFGVTGRR